MFSSRLKELREKRKLRISDIASRLGVSVSTYREWEYGREIKGEPYEKLAEIFDVSISYLMTGKDLSDEILILNEIESHLLEVLGRVKKIKGIL